MRIAALTAMLATAALAPAARAQGIPQLIGSDPLSREIVAETPRQNDGVTAAVRSGSGEVVVLHLADVKARFSTSLAPAAASPDERLKTAAGLARRKPKAAKARRMPRRAAAQLKHVRAHAKSW